MIHRWKSGGHYFRSHWKVSGSEDFRSWCQVCGSFSLVDVSQICCFGGKALSESNFGQCWW